MDRSIRPLAIHASDVLKLILLKKKKNSFFYKWTCTNNYTHSWYVHSTKELPYQWFIFRKSIEIPVFKKKSRVALSKPLITFLYFLSKKKVTSQLSINAKLQFQPLLSPNRIACGDLLFSLVRRLSLTAPNGNKDDDRIELTNTSASINDKQMTVALCEALGKQSVPSYFWCIQDSSWIHLRSSIHFPSDDIGSCAEAIASYEICW